MQRIAQDRIGTWRDGDEVRFDEEFHVLTMTVVARSLFSADIDGTFAADVLTALPPLPAGLTRRTLLPSPILQKLPTRSNREFETARRRLNGALWRIVTEYRADLLSMLREARDEAGARMSDQQLFDEVMTMLLAGTETSANAR